MSEHFYIRKEYMEAQHTALSQKSLQSLAETRSENTIGAYQSDWDDFCDWCRYHREEAFPARPSTIVNYINDLADNAKISTIRRRISAISENFNAAGLSSSNPCREWIVREALTGLARQKGALQKGKTPLYIEDMQKITEIIDVSRLSGLRDRAVLLLGFMGAFRRSELSGLNAEDVAFFPQGLVVTITHSKTDQESQGQQVGIPYLPDSPLCPVRALKSWLSAAGIHEGPLFRSVLKNNRPSPNRLSDKSINLLIKKYAEAIGLDPELYGAHSLRHGFATSAALCGVEERIIMKQTRHRSVEMVRHYINEAGLFINNPISLMFQNKR